MKRVVGLSLLVLMLVTGCKTRTEIKFNDDGSGAFTSLLELNIREFRLLSEQGNPIEQLIANAESVSFPVDVEEIKTSTTRGFRASFRFSDIGDMQTKLAELNEEDEGSSTLFKDAEIASDDDGWTFLARSGVDSPQTSELIDPKELEKLVDAQVIVTMPGERGDNNATSVETSEDSTTYTWQLNPGTEIELSAATVFPESLLDKLLGPLGIIIAAALVVLALAVASWQRSRRPTAGR